MPSAKMIVPNPNEAAWERAGQRINADVLLSTRLLFEAMSFFSTEAPDPANPKAGNFWAGLGFMVSRPIDIVSLEGSDKRFASETAEAKL